MISEFPDAVWRESGVISKEIPGFLEVNQKVLEMFLAPRALAGFGAVWLWVGRPLQIWGACLSPQSHQSRPLPAQLELVVLEEPLTLNCSVFINHPHLYNARKEYENTASEISVKDSYYPAPDGTSCTPGPTLNGCGLCQICT